MKCLDLWANHFSNLIIKEWLSFKVVMNKLKSSLVIWIGHFQSILVYIHVIICSQVNHESLSCRLFWLHITCIVVILLSAFKSITKCAMNLGFLFFWKSKCIKLFQKFGVWSQMRNVSIQICFTTIIPLITFIGISWSHSYSVNNLYSSNIFLLRSSLFFNL